MIDHDTIEKKNFVHRFVTHALTGQEEESFGIHLMDCSQCQDQVDLATASLSGAESAAGRDVQSAALDHAMLAFDRNADLAFRRDVKLAFERNPDLIDPAQDLMPEPLGHPANPITPSRYSRFLAYVAVPMAAVLVLGWGGWLLLNQPTAGMLPDIPKIPLAGLETEGRQAPVFRLRSGYRGNPGIKGSTEDSEEDQNHLAFGDGLWLQVQVRADLCVGSRLRFDFKNEDGKSVWRKTIARGSENKLDLPIEKGFFPAGAYQVIVSAGAVGSAFSECARHEFRIID